jgi:hypothetical protein
MSTTLNPLLIPGSVIQVVHSQLPAVLSIGIPGNFSATPLITEGVQIMTISITPKSAASLLLVEAKMNNGRRSGPSNGNNYMALFRVGTSQAKCADGTFCGSVSEFDIDQYLSFSETAGTTSAITFSSRIASPNGSGAVYISTTTWTSPTKQGSWMRITEVAA